MRATILARIRWSMMKTLSRSAALPLMLAGAALAVGLSAYGLVPVTDAVAAAAVRAETAPAQIALPTEAQAMFADAPDGVDPTVTGPVSASFRAMREALNCDEAVWPNIPAACYPD